MEAGEGSTGEPAIKLLRKIDRILATQDAILMQSEVTDNVLKELAFRVATLESYVVFAEEAKRKT